MGENRSFRKTMKTATISVCIATMVVLSGCAQDTNSLPKNWNVITNNVRVSENGMRMVISDETNFEAFETLVADTEVFANRDLSWILHKGVNSVAFLGMSNSFALNSFTTNGVPIPKTTKGKAMNAAPRSITNPYVGSFRRIGAGIRIFPKLDELFLFPSNGTYIVHVSYWDWSKIQNKFVTSNPVVLRVIKQDNPVVTK
jgi:hypothetical protein